MSQLRAQGALRCTWGNEVSSVEGIGFKDVAEGLKEVSGSSAGMLIWVTGAACCICTASAEAPQHPERVQRIVLRCCEMPCPCRSLPAVPNTAPVKAPQAAWWATAAAFHQQAVWQVAFTDAGCAHAACRPGMRQAVLRFSTVHHLHCV